MEAKSLIVCSKQLMAKNWAAFQLRYCILNELDVPTCAGPAHD